MKKKTFLKWGACLVLLVLQGSLAHVLAQTKGKVAQFRTATYNIRYDAAADKESGNNWDVRKEAVANLIQQHKFDVVGTQEGMTRQMIELKKLLPGYDYISYPYGGKNDHHHAAIVYKESEFELLDGGTFWLSETPDVPSIGWDANDRRICQWAKFMHRKSGKPFFYFNAHFFWQKEIARRESGSLIVRKIKEIAGDIPVICAGDFNSEPQTDQIKALKGLLQDAFDVSKGAHKGPEFTNLGGGNFQTPPTNRIDYILLSKGISVSDYEVYADKYNTDRYPSDHLPVSCIVKF